MAKSHQLDWSKPLPPEVAHLNERHDIFGLFILGIATPFAGGIIRNIALVVAMVPIWEQGYFV